MSIAITEKQFKEFMGYKKGYYRLKEENNNLQEKANQLLTSKNELWKEVEETQSKVDEMYEFSYFKKLKKAEAENKKLKEEVNTLKIQQEQLEGMGGVMAREGLNAISENHKLKEENKKLKRVIKEYEEDAEMCSTAVETLKFMDYVWNDSEKLWDTNESN